MLRRTAPCSSIRSPSLAGVEVAGKHGESGLAAAKAKTALAKSLIDQAEHEKVRGEHVRLSPEYEKALALLKKALRIYEAELSAEVRGARI